MKRKLNKWYEDHYLLHHSLNNKNKRKKINDWFRIMPDLYHHLDSEHKDVLVELLIEDDRAIDIDRMSMQEIADALDEDKKIELLKILKDEIEDDEDDDEELDISMMDIGDILDGMTNKQKNEMYSELLDYVDDKQVINILLESSKKNTIIENVDKVINFIKKELE